MSDNEQILKELMFAYVQSSGPGGQNVNKVATAVQLRFDIRNSAGLDVEIRHRLLKIAGKRVTGEGILLIEAKRFRSQEKNKADAIERLMTLIGKANEIPTQRLFTRPRAGAVTERLVEKKKRGEIKRNRTKNELNDWE